MPHLRLLLLLLLAVLITNAEATVLLQAFPTIIKYAILWYMSCIIHKVNQLLVVRCSCCCC
jgi:hypothetical protein